MPVQLAQTKGRNWRGKLIDEGTVRETLRYFDEFYETINDSRSARRSIIEPCIARP